MGLFISDGQLTRRPKTRRMFDLQSLRWPLGRAHEPPPEIGGTPGAPQDTDKLDKKTCSSPLSQPASSHRTARIPDVEACTQYWNIATRGESSSTVNMR
jgi:hypothetical protein